MSKRDVFMVHLRPAVEEPQFAPLHRFLHPGSLEKSGWRVMVCAKAEASEHPGFLLLRAKDFEEEGAKDIHIPYSLVAAVLEYSYRSNPPGFLGPEAFLGR